MTTFRHINCTCPLRGKLCRQVKPDPSAEPPSMGTSGKSIKVIFEGEREARWVAMEQVEVVRT